MKFQAALATALATKCLSSAIFTAEAKAPALSEKSARRLKVIQTISKLGADDGKKKRLLQMATARQRKRRLSAPQLSNSASLEQSQGNGDFDLGILGSTAKVLKNQEDLSEEHFPYARRLEEFGDYGDYASYLDDLIGYLQQMVTRPFAFTIEYSCDMFEYYDSCTTCEVTDVIDPATGNSTGAYNIEMDCPNLPAAYNSTYFDRWFGEICSPNYFCPDCDPLCNPCSVDAANSRFASNNCVLNDGISNALNLGEYQAYLQELLDDLDDIEELVEDLQEEFGDIFERPMASMLAPVCDFLNTQEYCATCEVTDVVDPYTGQITKSAGVGSYNIVFNCPRLPESSDTNEMFAYIQQSCDRDLCESCTVDPETMFFDMKNCNSGNLEDYYYAVSSTEVPDEVFFSIEDEPVAPAPPFEPNEEVSTSVEMGDWLEEEVAKADGSSSGARTSTLLALTLAGASWCLMMS
eukprot:CAMPEP_0116102488 /NCGR_PEP_ID=MMETSP0327-20121206/13377_1 /TAXON_ID=44447 /ORGANISM="Pseudo-nitzschia delicatissima, Strain B596" /LENGTH=464 /DNA_ID=CAMNT_0003594533 /DNA_START=29 /DNA_END=1423 /DNA_ORIENTATION=+